MSHPGEPERRLASLGSSRVAIAFPSALSSWFDGLAIPSETTVAAAVIISAEERAGYYRVNAEGTPEARGLTLGDALAAAWERLTFLLLNELDDAFAIHAAALRKEGAIVLLPGASGSGKTRLALWLRSQGYRLETDEVYAIEVSTSDRATTLVGSALLRPIILKDDADVDAVLRQEADQAPPQVAFAHGVIVKTTDVREVARRPIERGVVILPTFAAGAPLTLAALSPAEAALRLMGSCVNARNLPRGGVSIAATIGHRLTAIELRYGDTSQLDSVLDVLIRQVLAAAPDHEDMMALCAAFTAQAGRVSASSTPSSTRSIKPTYLDRTSSRYPRRLTIGMATFDDYDGTYFTIQAIRTYHPELEGQLEFVVVDNNPTGACAEALKDLEKWIDGYRYLPHGEWTGTAVRDILFQEASSEAVLCVDAHVLIAPGALTRLVDYMDADAGSPDLLQGPMLYDDLRSLSTHLNPVWRGGMFGVWGKDDRGAAINSPPFDIGMQGLGLFACRRAAWPGFNAAFRGFGGEEGYIHEKVRQHGGRTLCLPFLRWLHRFGRPTGPPYLNRWEDRIRNYTIGFKELGLGTEDMEAHFSELLGKEIAERIFEGIARELQAMTFEGETVHPHRRRRLALAKSNGAAPT